MGPGLSTNGSAIMAMTGDQCVSIAADKRFGIDARTVSTNFQKIFEIGPHLYIGLGGLVANTQDAMETLSFRKNMYELKENHRITPPVFSSMMSHMLYERRFQPYLVTPVVAGLMPKTFKPYVCSTDVIGCIYQPEDFVIVGTAEGQLFGMCEALWEPNMGPDELFEATAQALVNAFDRDAYSGWGAVVYVIEKDKITVRHVKTRMD